VTRGFFVVGDAVRRLFVSRGRLRAAWRILLFFLLFAALLFAFAPLAMLYGGSGSGVGPLVVQGIATLAAALCAGWLALTWFDRRRPGALGFAWTSRTLRELVVGLAIGGGPLLLVAAALALVGWLEYRPDAGGAGAYTAALLGALLALALPAAAEEALFRGYAFQVLVEAVGPVVATATFSAAFALAHAGNPGANVFALVNIFLAGVLLSAAYLRTRSLWFATAVHLGWNWTMGSVLDLPVSGLELLDTPLYEAIVSGPEWVTGGGFGPEAGLAGTLASLLALLAVMRLGVLGEAPEMKALRPLVDERP
jgi:membrane protease YdiL (CAAX protease family)